MLPRIKSLRQRLLDTPAHICIQRAEIITEAYKKYEAYPIVQKRALALTQVLRQMSIYIEENQLIAGNQTSRPRAAPLFPEYAYDFVLNELDSFSSRESDRFEISEDHKSRLRQLLPWWRGKTLYDRAVAIQPEKVLDDQRVGVLGWQGNVTSGEGHIIPDYEMLLELGFSGLLERVRGLLRDLDYSQPSELEKLTFYRACETVLGGCIDYIARCGALAKNQSKRDNDPVRARELQEIADRCDALTRRSPETFAEALQCCWFGHVILHIESNGHSLSLGRLDQYLYPYYQKDLARAALSEQHARELLGCFYLKVYGNNKLRSWGTTRTQLGYPTYQNICLGGQTPDGKDAVNPLSHLCLEALGDIRLPEPNVYIRLHEGTPRGFMLKAAAVVRMGFGMPSFVNDQSVIPALLRVGVSKQDALNYATMGCVEVQTPGKWGYRANGKSKINLLRIFEFALNGGRDPKTGSLVLEELTPLEDCGDIEQFKEQYKKALEYYMELHVIADNINDMAMDEVVPDALCSLLVQDCLGRGKTIKQGGSVYDFISGTLVGVANVGNSTQAIKEVIFDKKLISAGELKEALAANFEGERGEYIRSLLLSAAKYGNDIDEVDRLTQEMSDYFTAQINRYKTMREGKGPIGCHYTSSTVTITANISCGASVGATPDGRKAGEPTAEGTSPARGTLRNGITAMFGSVAKQSNELFTGGQILNVRIDPNTLDSPKDLEKFVDMLRAVGDLRCWHSQYNMFNDATLRDAQQNPEKYPDLIVRVAGYSAMFTSLNKELQEDIIARAQFSL